MRRLLRIRLLVVLAALLVVPALAQPFATRLRDEWTRFWEPKRPESVDPAVIADNADAQRRAFFEALRQSDLRASGGQGPPGAGWVGGAWAGGASDEIGPVRIEFIEGDDVIILGPRNGPPIDLESAGTTAGSNAPADVQRRAFFEALRSPQSGRRTPSQPRFETVDEAELIDVNELLDASQPALQVPLKPRTGP